MGIAEALKNLAVALGCAESADEVAGTQIVEVIQFIADNYEAPTGGEG